ncbi:MAG: acetoacetate decarboxylase family protein [Gemmatimonadetes bacterium]|nr:acetoacetate decarboxylase family protein [Gemmatimonadota bacterium]
MPYKIHPGRMYMMPTHFGPAAGPRQGPDGRRFDGQHSPRTTSYSVSFLTRPEQLEVLLPMGFRLAGDPVVTVTVSYMTGIEWLAGRGYNTLGVSFPAEYRGKRDRARGPFLAVLWENLADPILTGREQLGFSKIYCAIPPPSVQNGETRCTADWLGFRFMEMYLSEMETPPASPADETTVETDGTDEAAAPADEAAAPADEAAVETDGTDEAVAGTDGTALNGTLHYKYIPRTGQWDVADAEYAVMTPSDTPNRRVTAQRSGQGRVRFHRAEWQDLPTQYHIVNAIAGLEQIAFVSAGIVETVGGKDLSDQRILR